MPVFFFFFFCNFYVSAVPKKKRTYLTVYLFSLGSLERAAGIQDLKVEKKKKANFTPTLLM